VLKDEVEKEVIQSPDISVRKIASALNISKSSLYNHWDLGISPKRFLLNQRLMMALKLIGRDKKIGEIADELKFCDHIYFSNWFKRHCGISPKKFQLRYGSDFRHGRYDKICQELKNLAFLEFPQSGREAFSFQSTRDSLSQFNREMSFTNGVSSRPNLPSSRAGGEGRGDKKDPRFFKNGKNPKRKEVI